MNKIKFLAFSQRSRTYDFFHSITREGGFWSLTAEFSCPDAAFCPSLFHDECNTKKKLPWVLQSSLQSSTIGENWNTFQNSAAK